MQNNGRDFNISEKIHKRMIKNFGLEGIGVSQPFSHYDLYKESS